MSGAGTQSPCRAADLRRAFDDGFAAPRRGRFEGTEDLITFEIFGDGYAVPVGAVTGIAELQRLVHVPSRSPYLLGLAAVRGTLVPVYDLAGLLGYPQRGDHARRMVLCGSEERLALALGNFSGHASFPKTGHLDAVRDGRVHIARVVVIGGVVRAVIDVASIVAAIKGGAASAPTDRGT
jgi:chemotaxis signal transduction protein